MSPESLRVIRDVVRETVEALLGDPESGMRMRHCGLPIHNCHISPGKPAKENAPLNGSVRNTPSVVRSPVQLVVEYCRNCNGYSLPVGVKVCNGCINWGSRDTVVSSPLVGSLGDDVRQRKAHTTFRGTSSSNRSTRGLNEKDRKKILSIAREGLRSSLRIEEIISGEDRLAKAVAAKHSRSQSLPGKRAAGNYLESNHKSVPNTMGHHHRNQTTSFQSFDSNLNSAEDSLGRKKSPGGLPSPLGLSPFEMLRNPEQPVASQPAMRTVPSMVLSSGSDRRMASVAGAVPPLVESPISTRTTATRNRAMGLGAVYAPSTPTTPSGVSPDMTNMASWNAPSERSMHDEPSRSSIPSGIPALKIEKITERSAWLGGSPTSGNVYTNM